LFAALVLIEFTIMQQLVNSNNKKKKKDDGTRRRNRSAFTKGTSHGHPGSIEIVTTQTKPLVSKRVRIYTPTESKNND